MGKAVQKALEVLKNAFEDGFDGVVLFEIEDQGSIVLDHNGARIGQQDANCTLRASEQTFRKLLAGEINPATAYMSGELAIDGDLGIAMRLADQLK